MSGFAVGMAVGAVLVFALTVAAKNRGPLDDTDDHATGTRSNMRVLIDHKTGCQYLLSDGGGLTPRLDATGKHICAKEVPHG
ncbi:hypothetical protein TSH7_01375 [Azospirillum sp. TSH7]|uniref:DUF6440 family protein n=1 Tax=unclassified Azospirillum TaxID=2630922 RepID=UPI000D61EA4E|nr:MULTISPECIES: DUF6440 family protein [unclassified Azospirillum]PWC69123.1 hypothetical protein TSH7_01375 [Azospirillum sp. TSH7]PWC71385.1 hypothetical protein TSH20_03700 [Azospirillum sp. TSH20]